MKLDNNSINAIRTVAGFTKVFEIETLLLSPSHTVAVDEVPTLVIFFDMSTAYVGPPLGLVRLKVLEQRLAQPATSVEIMENNQGKPTSIKLKSGRSSLDFKLANDKLTTRLPKAFTGKFAHTLDMSVTDLAELVKGARIIDAKFLIFKSVDSVITASGSSESEAFSLMLDPSITTTTADFTYTYSVAHLNGLLKLKQSQRGFSPDDVFECKLTVNGQLATNVKTDNICAQIFLMDIKNR
jgi:hypothetical protein